SVVLAAIGGVASVLVAWLGTHALSGVNPAALRLQRGAALGVVTFSSISLDWTALGFTFGIALLVGLLFGLAPALHATRSSVSNALKEGGAAAGAKHRGAPTGRRVLVVAEVSLALVLLAGSGLM